MRAGTGENQMRPLRFRPENAGRRQGWCEGGCGDGPDYDPDHGRLRQLHVTRAALARYRLPPAEFGLYGRVLRVDGAAAVTWSARVNAGRGQTPGTAPRPVSPGLLLAAVALHELMHALIEATTAPGTRFEGVIADAAARLATSLGSGALGELGDSFTVTYAPAGGVSGPVARAVRTEPAGEVQVLAEELLLLELAHANPALEPLADLFAAAEVTGARQWRKAVAVIERALSGGQAAERGTAQQAATGRRDAATAHREPGARAGLAGSGANLLDLLLAPQRRRPGSLAEQLTLALELWTPYLAELYPQALDQARRAADVLREEYTPPPGPPGPPVQQQADDYDPLVDGEPEAFSPDSSWMPGVVLVAKSTYVWLAQLTRRFGREIRTLDAVPDEALAELAAQGFNALWLIGVWWRSEASKSIKRLRGQPEALASAYSVRDYVVAPELGGDDAMVRLRERAARHGLRLASDMVPNHTAIDSRWVIEQPNWFVQTAAPPYPGYSFTGPDLSPDGRVSLRIEDHYYDGSDAAVVFQRVDNETGEARYIYHGNDGTALPWNDTAQLDFLHPEVRQAVIDTTVEVARAFPLIRLDAAMTLARRHVRRLWHPQPGEGGAVPSRALLAESAYEFDKRMPQEFWRELVDALAERAPGTMLLAEAFWLMEVYFVRTLGMHRVYNSAFMHMTKKEENAEYRRYLKRYLAQSPDVLGRFVNYMSNPDEEPVAAQFGDGDKAFGVTTLLATLPGLPMFGHGQVEGLTEKYGMEFAAPRMDEEPREWHVARHMQQIAPLLRARHLFAGSRLFRLFDLVVPGGAVAEDVYVYVNGAGDERVLVAYNNSPHSVSGRVWSGAPVGGSAGEARTGLSEALGLDADAPGEAVFTALGGWELRLDVRRLEQQGLPLDLAPYQATVFMSVRQQERPPQAALRVRAAPARRHRGSASLAGPRGAAARRRAARRRR